MGIQLIVDNELAKEKLQKPQSPPIIVTTQKECIKEVVTQLTEDTTKKNIERAIIKSVPLELGK